MEKVELKKIKVDAKWLQMMRNRLKSRIDSLLMKRQREKRETEETNNNDYVVHLIRKAKIDLEQSKNFFANVTDPDLVDYAAHKILANQSFYAYLLKKAKAENVTSGITSREF